MPSNQEIIRFHSYALPTIQVTKYVDSEAENGAVMYDLYLDGVREQRYDIQGLLYRLELMFRITGFKTVEGMSIDSFKKGEV